MTILHIPKLLLTGLLLALALSGCSAIRPNPPEVQLAGLTISDLTLSHANFLATLALYNPNNATLELEGLEFALFLDDVQVARGATSKEFSIPSEQTGNVPLRMSAGLFDLFRFSQRLKDLDQVPFRIVGKLQVGGPGFLWMTVPIESKGAIPLVGTLDRLIFTPEDFWRQPEKFLPEESSPSAAPKPKGR